VGGRVFAGAATGGVPGGAPARDEAPRRAVAAAGSRPTRRASARGKPGLTLRLADGSEADCRAGIHLAREAHGRTIFRDIPFSEDKARAIYTKAVAQPERFGLIYAVPGADAPLKIDGLLGFASVQAGEYFLGTGTLIATVQTLNISQKIAGTLLGGKVALRLVQAVRHWAKERGCAHLMVHVTNGENAEDADRFFRRCGMVTVGGNYSWSL
jgi:GNAT superfamily N-acetyltransferase